MPENLGDAFNWLGRLYEELGSRAREMQMFSDYYENEHPLPFLTTAHNAKMNGEFNRMLDDSRSNFMELVVDSVAERLAVEGFRLSASTDRAADRESWRIWQENDLDSEIQSGMLESLIKGVSYLSVWAGEEGKAEITVEDPLETIVGYESGSNFRRRAAALKVWIDNVTGKRRANVYLRDGIYKFVQIDDNANEPAVKIGDTADETTFEGPKTIGGSVRIDLASARAGRWAFLVDEFVENPLSIVPIIPLRSRGKLLREGRSELASVYRTQNQINGFLFLLALAGYFGAHRQRWAIGLTIMEDKKTGKPVEPFRTAVDTLWVSEDPQTKFGEFTATDLDGYIKAIEQKVQHIAVVTRTPRHYLLPEGQEPSGDSISSAEAGLINKVAQRQTGFSTAIEETMRLARRFMGEDETPADSEVVWRDPAIRSDAEIADAAVKKWQLGVITHRQLLEDLGYTQTQITAMMLELGNVKPPDPSAPAPVQPAPDVV